MIELFSSSLKLFLEVPAPFFMSPPGYSNIWISPHCFACPPCHLQVCVYSWIWVQFSTEIQASLSRLQQAYKLNISEVFFFKITFITEKGKDQAHLIKTTFSMYWKYLSKKRLPHHTFSSDCQLSLSLNRLNWWIRFSTIWSVICFASMP